MAAPAALRRFAPSSYYLLYNAAIVFILPYLAILWRSQGFSGSQIGVLAAVRPFTAAISGQLLVGVADACRTHFAVVLVTYLLTLAARGSMALANGFIFHLLLNLLSEFSQSPFSIITDAAIASSTDEAGYGRARVLASLGWGSLAPLSGWIVGQYGVPTSISVYFALVLVALVPTLLLPLRELARKGTSAAAEAEAPPSLPVAAKAASITAARGGGTAAARGALLLPPAAPSSHELDERQHDGHAAGLAIELGAPWPQHDGAAAAAAAAAEAAGSELVEHITSKLSQASAAPAQITLLPLLTTAEEDAASEAASARSSIAAEAAAPPSQDSSGWSIAAVGSPLAAQRSRLPPIACSQLVHAGAALSPGFTPGGSSYGSGPLARTTSAVTSAYFSVTSDGSLSGRGGSLYSPAGPAGPAQPRSALLAQLAGAAGSQPMAVAGQRSSADGTGSLPGSLPSSLPRHPLSRQLSAASPAASAAATPRGGGSQHRPPLGASALFRQPSDLASVYFTPQQQQQQLASQPSNLSQVLTGFDLPSPAGSPAAAAAVGMAEVEGDTPHLLLSQISNLSQALSGFEPGVLEGGAPAPCKPSPLRSTVEIKVVCGSPGPAYSGAGGAQPASPAAAPRPAPPTNMAVWAGVKQMLSVPRNAAFFATTFLMGIGYGALGYEQLFLKESGAPGLLLGVALLVGTCGGELPVFASTAWWLPKLGLERAFALGMCGFILRLALYTLIPFLPTLWLVLPIELLQGLTFAMSYGCGTLRCRAIAPPHLRSTTQSMFFCCYYGIGPGISGLAGGYIYERLGMRMAFVIFSLVLAGGWAAVLLALRWATRGERR